MEQVATTRSNTTTKRLKAVPAQLTLTDALAPDQRVRRLMGSYYSPPSAADYIAAWSIRHDAEHVLEPSFGGGVFLRAIEVAAGRQGFVSTHVSGVEIEKETCSQAVALGMLRADDAHNNDFLTVEPFKVQAVVGNPPYVRLRHLPEEQRLHALRASAHVLGKPMDPSGSVWMAFLLHAMRFLDEGGRLALVLPYDITYVRYARPLWATLGAHFGSLRLLRTHERLFPDLLQEVVILLADDYGSCTDRVQFQAFERVADLLCGNASSDEFLSIEQVMQGERVFLAALLSTELRQLLSGRVARMTVSARQLVTFNIGYVTGDKTFFHPAEQVIRDYSLPSTSLRRTLTSARLLKGAGLCTANLDTYQSGKSGYLYLPDDNALTSEDRRYIAAGAESGVQHRYKCRIRDPWYCVPAVRVPDVVLTVFSERPVLLINDGGHMASNSLLCGYRHAATSEEIAVGWYTSLTALQCELEVHALGGGVMVMVPREAGNVRLPRRVSADSTHLSELNQLLQLGKTSEAYRCGDRNILIDQLGFTETEVELVRQGIYVLSHWRTSARATKY